MKYVNSVLSRYCYEELSDLFVKTSNPVKEITESYAAFHHIKHALKKDNIMLDATFNLHIGDGSTGRTGGLFTFMSKSFNISIDPQTNIEYLRKWKEKHGVKRFSAYKGLWQDFPIHALNTVYPKKDHLNLIFVHSHVNTLEVMHKFKNWKYAYVNPCCMKDKQLLTVSQMEKNNIAVVTAGEDTHILSPENYVVVYKNMNNA